MSAFGDQLRTFRQRCHDSKSPHGKLTQETFGQLVGKEIGINGYTGAAVSDWERGKSKIHAEDRSILMAIIDVLHEQGGLNTIEEADQLLAAGNFRGLDSGEIQKLFSVTADSVPDQPSEVDRKALTSPPYSLLGSVFNLSEAELQEWTLKIQKGPVPSWPRWLAAFLRLASNRFSISVTTVMWFWVGLLAWWLIAPSLRWPFGDRVAAFQAITAYAMGTLIVPLIIGLLINTKQNEYWKTQGLSESAILRLYTYQGAAIGFNLGYFFVFPLVLIRYYLGFGPSLWLEFAAVALGLILGNMAGRVVPHNLLLVYERLHIKDGAIFFAVALLGPLWGVFFLEYYSILLTPLLGSVIILTALTISIVIAARQAKKSSQGQPSLKE